MTDISVFIENDQQGATVHVISALKGQTWGNKLDSSCQFNMEEFIAAVSGGLGIPNASSSAGGMA